ncbi:hypothetical protein A5745_16770 [Mycobacterium sp. IS-2888]|uniref:hypothetical protein n=1 Tax=Mycobacterium sp. IS-2888 TaxID=1834159 RepID=UPI00096F6230|nr:hypothetical protein [Mycobacterium sp. IS-2888]OMC44090.1 hypothetical protein A5745_16770 [Mycobacterium sp. IS-2888]
MDTLRVPTSDLLATASGWHGLGAELIPAAVPSGLGLSCQASAAAVNAVHASAAAAGGAFATRTQLTALKTAAAALGYASSDVDSADLIDAIIDSL